MPKFFCKLLKNYFYSTFFLPTQKCSLIHFIQTKFPTTKNTYICCEPESCQNGVDYTSNCNVGVHVQVVLFHSHFDVAVQIREQCLDLLQDLNRKIKIQISTYNSRITMKCVPFLASCSCPGRNHAELELKNGVVPATVSHLCQKRRSSHRSTLSTILRLEGGFSCESYLIVDKW